MDTKFKKGQVVNAPFGRGIITSINESGKYLSYTVTRKDKLRMIYHEDQLEDVGYKLNDMSLYEEHSFFESSRKIYLSIPYSHPTEKIMQRRYRLANQVAGDLMADGHVVFSPISHSHAIESEMGQRHGHDFWMKQDLSYIQENWADAVVLIHAMGWRQSSGVQEEVRQAVLNDVSVFRYDPIQAMDIIGISGRKRSGKDTFGSVLEEMYDFETYAFADPIRDIARDVFMLRESQVAGSEKEVEDDRWGMSPRKIMQLIGTEAFREAFGEQIWPNVLLNRLRFELPRKVAITDVRFPNEVESLKQVGGTVVRIDADERLGEADDEHASEVALQDYSNFDFRIDNNGSEEAFIYRCKELARYESLV